MDMKISHLIKETVLFMMTISIFMLEAALNQNSLAAVQKKQRTYVLYFVSHLQENQ